MPRPLPLLLALSRETLSLNQQDLADLVGGSCRSVQRWEAARSTPQPQSIHLLIDALLPHDPALAAELELWAPRPKAAAVLAEAPRPAAEPPLPPASAATPAPAPMVPFAQRTQPRVETAAAPPVPATPSHVLVDSVVCAAAESASLLPQAIRPAILAAFVRAREGGLTIDGVIGVLAPIEATKAKD